MVIVAAVVLAVLLGIAALALDGGNDYLQRVRAQNATDAAALAGGKQLARTGTYLSGPPTSSNDPSLEAVNEFATNNGYPTTRTTACDSTTVTQAATLFTATWTDGPSCSAPGGWTNRITVHVPPVVVAGVTVPSDCTGPSQYNCLQVVLTHKVGNYLGQLVGVPTTSITVLAVVYAQPPATTLGTPPAVALLLYEPPSGFATTQAPSHAGLSCVNCPTFWTAPPTASGSRNVVLAGVNGGTVAGGPVDMTALQSNGHMVVEAPTTICDPYVASPGSPPASCTAGQAVGAKGFAVNPTATLYCRPPLQGSTTGLAPCTSPGPANVPLDSLFANETTFTLQSWTAPSPDTSALADCGGIVLNGESVASHNLPGACAPPSSDPYTLMPGRYHHIVINHGSYQFAPGLFDIYGTAPVNTQTESGYTANGIDHSRETAADFDLCTGGQPNSCPTLTAGVWIGHGGGSYAPYTPGTAPSCTGGPAGSGGGGGDATVVQGTGVSFYFEPSSSNPTANAFVATNEVTSVSLSAPGLGVLAAVHGLPLLFDVETSGFVHLDSQPPARKHGGGTAPSSFAGIVYQTPGASGGGVEVNPSLSGGVAGAIQGQVLAYSFTTFGGGGQAVDFSQGYGSAGGPRIGTSGRNESEIIGTPAPSVVAASPGYETFVLNYTDEWALDAYDVYVKVNGGSPRFFSQGIWNSRPPANAVLPPNPNTPGDSNPAYPDYVQAQTGTVTGGNGTYATKLNPATGQYDDWTFTYADGSSIEVYGNWTWGHEKDIPGSTEGTNTATIKYTFPVPPGQAVTVSIFMTDGDHCGDYATATYTFNNVGTPAAGQQTSGAVQLEE